jgi:hypothetical protein
MPQSSSIPFNIALLDLTPNKIASIRPTRSLDIFEGNSGNFAEDGFFSVSTFGKVGDPRRNRRFSFIDIKIAVFHPAVYRAFVALKRMYAGILSGTEYVLWNDELGDFERADATSGKTGFAYFVKYWKQIKFAETKSVTRMQNILLLQNFKDKAMTNKIIVMPAGLRDIEVGDDGRTQEDEINGMYRTLLSISNTIAESTVANNPEVIDTARYTLQMKFIEIYETVERMIEGKKKLLLGKWATRAIMNGTRNVITAMDTSVPYLGGPGAATFNSTIVGLYQAAKAILPVTQYLLRNGFLSKVFQSVNTPATLVNKKTLAREQVLLKPAYFTQWMTDEGLEKVLTRFAEETLRDQPIEIDGRYLGLIYKGPDGTFRFLQDISELPEGRLKEHVTPITMCELIYLSGYREWNKYAIYVTRYPVTGPGSIYPSWMHVRTTIKAEVRRELDDQWTPMGDEYIAYDFPTQGPYINSMVPHSSKLDRLTADFDGDMTSGNAVYTLEALEEVRNHFSLKRAYVDTTGEFLFSIGVSTVNLVFHNMTGD